jgi:hypothetical protein
VSLGVISTLVLAGAAFLLFGFTSGQPVQVGPITIKGSGQLSWFQSLVMHSVGVLCLFLACAFALGLLPPHPSVPFTPTESPSNTLPSTTGQPASASPGPIFSDTSGVSLSLSPTRGPIGTAVIVHGSGFSGGERVEIDLNGQRFGDVSANPAGQFETVLKPADYQSYVSASSLTVSATGQSSGATSSADFTLS